MLTAIEICLTGIAVVVAYIAPGCGASWFEEIQKTFLRLARRRSAAVAIVGLMCAAICWMLQGWVPAGWALLGGFLAIMRLAVFSYWTNTYYGGAVAATGGALVLGALPRIKRRQRVRDALAMGLGLAILANSRPYESLFFGVPIAGSLLVWMFGKNHPRVQISMRRVFFPLILVLVLTISVIGYYFWRVTGNPFRIPYQVNMANYHLVYFPWEKLTPTAEYHHTVVRDFYHGPPVAGQIGRASCRERV